jgi:pimeloyl-ACP methyl ester carboxylesterase
MATLAFHRTGTGPPLVLLHPLGSSSRVWTPVLPALAEHFTVYAVDLPGFGDSAALPATQEPAPAVLAAEVGGLLDELGIAAPHVVGNSLGGWVALELAGRRPVASLTLLAPAGLWQKDTPVYCRVTLGASRWLARHAEGLLLRMVAHPLGRVVVLGHTHGRPARMTAAQARQAVLDLGRCPGFDATFRATLRRRYETGPLEAPVTVAYGSRDRVILRRQSRHLERLPATTVVASLPGCGHLPVADDPAAVAALITASTGQPVAMSSASTVPSSKSVTNACRPSGVTAMLVGLPPARIRAVTRPVTVSTTATVPSSTSAV